MTLASPRSVRRFVPSFSQRISVTEKPIQLAAFAEGENGTVVEIAAGEATAKRLADLGFVRGGYVEMIRSGRPCLVRIGPTCIGLGREIQQVILLYRDDGNGHIAPVPGSVG
jgi:Fe2+ transport system protein FeoA